MNDGWISFVCSSFKLLVWLGNWKSLEIVLYCCIIMAWWGSFKLPFWRQIMIFGLLLVAPVLYHECACDWPRPLAPQVLVRSHCSLTLWTELSVNTGPKLAAAAARCSHHEKTSDICRESDCPQPPPGWRFVKVTSRRSSGARSCPHAAEMFMLLFVLQVHWGQRVKIRYV